MVCIHIFCFLCRKKTWKHVKHKQQLVQDIIPLPSIYIQICTLYTYTNTCMPRLSPSGFFEPSRCLMTTPGLTPDYPICAVYVCVCVYTHLHLHTLPPALKIENTQTTPLSLLPSKISLQPKKQVPSYQWIKQLLRIFGPELIRINTLIKTARSAVFFLRRQPQILKTRH